MEGDLFLVPLRDSTQYGLGLLARKNRSIALGYFFNFICDGPEDNALNGLNIDKLPIIWVVRFGCLGFDLGTWLFLKKMDNWNRDNWKIPDLGRKDMLLENIYYGISLNEKLEGITTRKIDKETFELLPKDGLAGYGFVEIKLKKLLEFCPPLP